MAAQVQSSATRSAREVVVRSTAAMCMRSCAGVTMPAWCSPVNGKVVAPPPCCVEVPRPEPSWPATKPPAASATSRSTSNATRAPSRFAWTSHRSVCDQISSPPVILPVATSSRSAFAPLAIWNASKVKPGASTASTTAWVVATRPAAAASSCPCVSGVYATPPLAPARRGVVAGHAGGGERRVPDIRAPTWSLAYEPWDSAASASWVAAWPVGPTGVPESVTVKSDLMPSPTMPGLHWVT